MDRVKAKKTGIIHPRKEGEIPYPDGTKGSRKGPESLPYALMDHWSASVFCKDREGRFIFVNKKFAATLGKRPEEVVGKTSADFFPEELAKKYRQEDIRVIQTGDPLETVVERAGPGGVGNHVNP